MKILTFTMLYPNSAQPRHGIFVEQRLRHLVGSGEVWARVVAPVPWFPMGHSLFGKYASYARVVPCEERHGISVWHPRYPAIPKIGMTLAPFLLAAASTSVLHHLSKDNFNFDLIDAHYFYPDGVAAILLGRRLGKPVVITARGTDINLIPQYRLPRKMIRWAAEHAAGIVTVCQALKDALRGLGVASEKITVLRNGVDLSLFRPVDRQVQRAQLGLSKTTLLSVGHLIGRKGHDIAIRSLVELPEVELLIAGDGEEAATLQALARSLGVAERVRFIGAIKQEELKNYYGAADALVLASSREGWANVLLESMACGTPVIASNVWGTPEIVRSPEAGILMEERSPAGLVRAFRELFAHYPDRAGTRRYAEQFSWDETTRGQLALFRRVVPARVR